MNGRTACHEVCYSVKQVYNLEFQLRFMWLSQKFDLFKSGMAPVPLSGGGGLISASNPDRGCKVIYRGDGDEVWGQNGVVVLMA